MKNIKFLLVIGCLASLTMLSGCSVFMAAKQPPKKDLSVLKKGTARNEVIAELGSPEWSEKVEGKTTDVFSFRQGYSKGAKVGRAAFHGVADVFSFGLWEVIGTPVEAIADGEQIKLQIKYDEDDRVNEVTYLDNKTSKSSSSTQSSQKN